MTSFGTCEGLEGCASRGEKLKCGEIGESGVSGAFCEPGETGESGEFFANLVYLVSPVVLTSPDALEVTVF